MNNERSTGRSFAELMRGVRRLEHDRVEHERPRPAPKRHGRPDDNREVNDWQDINEEDRSMPEDDYHRPGVQRGLLRKLKRGQFRITAEIDLHGLRLSQARQTLRAFLADAAHERMCCVRVIHGKGFSSPNLQPVLKPNVRHWLRQDERVLAYTAVHDRAGGSGALHVLLRAR